MRMRINRAPRPFSCDVAGLYPRTKMWIFLTTLLIVTPCVMSRSAGPPTRACSSLRPQHGGAVPMTGNGGFFISTNIPANPAQTGYDYAAGRTYSVDLVSRNVNVGFRGFAVRALSVPGGVGIGTFIANFQLNQQIYNCGDGLQNTIVHNNPQRTSFTRQVFTWVAPDSAGTVNFVYTVVQQYSNYWVMLSAIAENPVTPPPATSSPATTATPTIATATPTIATPTTATPTTATPTTATPTTATPTTATPTTATPTIVTPTTATPTTAEPTQIPISTPTRNPMDYDLIFRDPANCSPGQCTIFVGIDTNAGNSDYLDIYMEGESQGWVAVGFTATPNMFAADVLGCTINTDSGMVEVLDTWNVAQGRNNVLDTVQDAFLFSGRSANGRISCSIGRSIAGTGTTQDVNLNGDYYVLYGRRTTASAPGVLNTHSGTASNPFVSARQFNPASRTTVTTAAPTQVPLPSGVSRPTRNPMDYDLIFRDPANCSPGQCIIFVGIDTNAGNSDYLDIYMEGESQGWVAVGFTATPNMFAADVLGCTINTDSGMVEVLDTWNVAQGRNNVLDTVQDAFLFSGRSANGRISCSIGRSIAGTGTTQDVNLNGDYYVLYGRRTTASAPGVLNTHSGTASNPFVSARQFNPTSRTTVTTAAPTLASLPSGVSRPVTSSNNYPLFFADPQGCSPSECRIFVGVERNTGNMDYLNFYIEGEARAWVAVGFSSTANMFSADVLACNMNPTTGMVEVLDTWNIGNGRNNILDAVQDTFVFSATSQNGRISCSFGRSIVGDGSTQDLNLGGDYYVIYGRSNNAPRPGSLMTHFGGGENPPISQNLVNVINDTGAQRVDVFGAIKIRLIRAHGVLMLIAWPLLASSAIFFAAWMRPALPNGEWFQVHRAFMLIALFLAAAGFVLIFVSQLRSTPSGLIDLSSRTKTAHLAIGIMVMVLQITNPLIAICRCHPGTKNRWIFNIIHGFPGIGFIVQILALSNVGLGISLFSNQFSRFMDLSILWLYVAYCGFSLLMQLTLLIVLKYYNTLRKDTEEEYQVKYSDRSGDGDKVTIEHKKEEGKDGEDEKDKAKKKPSKDSVYRWIGLVVFLTVTTLTVITLFVLILI